jgi:hypothetical protein
METNLTRGWTIRSHTNAFAVYHLQLSEIFGRLCTWQATVAGGKEYPELRRRLGFLAARAVRLHEYMVMKSR